MAVKKNKQIERYIESVGRRKSATARVRLFEKHKDKGTIKVNEKDFSSVFPTKELREFIENPLKKTETEKKFYVTIKVSGGGIKGQAGAIRLGISRALIKFKQDFRSVLKAEKFLTCDSRIKERRKFGLKKARKAPQWSKR